MKLFQQIDRLNRLHQLIKTKRTGTSSDLANKLQISKSHVYNMIYELKEKGAPIKYSRSKRVYYYEKDFEMTVSYAFKLLENDEILLSAGFSMNILNTLNKNFCYSSFIGM